MQLNPHPKCALLFSLFLVLSAMFAAVTPTDARTLGATPDADALTARAIVSRAHEAAGGDAWRRPITLHLRGRAILYKDGVRSARTVADHYELWRVFPTGNTDAHDASGKVRVEARSGGHTLFLIAYDGKHTYNQNGLMPDAKASAEWSAAFGFGIIRFALDEGFSLTRLADDQVEGHPAFNVSVRDPHGGTTLFWIDRESYALRKVGFDTPRGWHERIYSGFEYHQNPRFQQATRVRLYYDGALTNDITWRHYAVNAPIADDMFVIEGPERAAAEGKPDPDAAG